MAKNWICCQIGAREHYAVARGLAQAGALRCLLTDAWVPPGSPLGLIDAKLKERYHTELAGAGVKSWTSGLLGFELAARLRQVQGWNRIIARNSWFQHRVVQSLSMMKLGNQKVGIKADCGLQTASPQPTIFAYSYAALEIFRWAKNSGWRTVLGQIDPALHEERIVAGLHRNSPLLAGDWAPAPASYWESWRAECALADHIVVNSKWSCSGLVAEGIPAARIAVIPLAYQVPEEAARFARSYPESFTSKRPLRVLFLGQINLRKGMSVILEAIRLLKDQPVEWWFVGSSGMQLPLGFEHEPGVRFLGPQSRSATAQFYREADVFLFPTLSDGFGLTQLEAMAWKLPVIASRRCGEVVTDGVNGLLLDEVDPQGIMSAIQLCLQRPELLAQFARACRVASEFHPANLASKLFNLISKPEDLAELDGINA